MTLTRFKFNLKFAGTELKTEGTLEIFKMIALKKGATNYRVFASRINPENKVIKFELKGFEATATATKI